MSARVRGHALQGEGAPYERTETGRMVRVGFYGGLGGEGRALCECGAVSEILPSSTQRRKWHRVHKIEARS